MLAAYLTGHGFGHVVRTCEVLAQVRRALPALPITVVGEVPAAMVRGWVAPPLELRPVACDVGMAQYDALRIDEEETARRCRTFDAGWEGHLERERQWLRAAGARVVLADVPPLPLAAAASLGLAALALANFSWDWIWRRYADRHPAIRASAERAAAAYAQADAVLELPFAGGLDVFRRRLPVGLVARRPTVGRAESRRRLGLDERTAALVAFGGIPVRGLGRVELARDPGITWLFGDELDAPRLAAAGLRFPDVVAAVDAVVSKPGYGIASDCIAAGTPLVYTDRGDFAEYEVMVRELPHWLVAVHVARDDLHGPHLPAAIRRAAGCPPVPCPDLDGAQRAADVLVEAIRRA